MNQHNDNQPKISGLQVMQSASGYYVGRGTSKPADGIFDAVLPYSRDSEYYETHKLAEEALERMLAQNDEELLKLVTPVKPESMTIH